MKIVVQRVKNAFVEVNNKKVGIIDKGLVLLVSFKINDTEDLLDYMVNKILKLRIFDDENGIMNRSIQDINGEILSISQFTLYGDVKKSNRPSYSNSMSSKEAKELYDKFNKKLESYVKVETGIFGSEMEVGLINDGPVTIIVEKEN